MLYNTHMVAGLLATETYLYATHYPINAQNVLLVGGSLVASMLFATIPDTDQPHSWAGKRLFPLSFLLSVLHVKHRGLTHSLLFTLLVWFLLTLTPLPSIIITGAIVGYCSHWFIDMFNTTGIQIFYPLQMKVKFGTNIPVNTIGEALVRYLLCGLVIVFAYLYAQPLLATYGITQKIHFLFSRFLSI